MLRAIIDAECGNQHEFARRIGVSYDVIKTSLKKNSCSDQLVDALSKYYGADYGFLQREMNNWLNKR